MRTLKEEEIDCRLKSDFLCHCNHDGLYADFHSLRHWFITGLARAGDFFRHDSAQLADAVLRLAR